MTWRFSARHDPELAAAERRAATRRAASSAVVGKRERAEEANAIIASDASSASHAVTVAGSVTRDAARDAARRRSPATGSSRGRPAAELDPVARRPASRRAGRRARPASRRAAARPAMPVTRDRRRRRRAAPRTPAAIAAAVSAETAPCSASSAAGTPELRLLHLVRVRDDAAEEDVARARAPRSAAPRRARRCTTRRSRASSPRARHEVEHELLDRRARRARTGTRSSGSAERLLERRRRAPRRPARRAGRRGSRSRARRSSPPRRPRRRRRPRAPSRPPTRSRRRTAARAAPGRAARASTRRTGSVSSARGHSRCSSAGGPGSTTTDAAPGVEHEPRRRARRARARCAPSGSVACFAHAGLEVRVRPLQALGDPPRDRADLRVAAPRRATQLATRHVARRSSTVRSSCVGPSPPETTAQVGLERPRRSAASSSSGSSPTIEIRAGSSPSESSSRGEERAVQVGALAADQLAAGDDDRRARPQLGGGPCGDDQAARLAAAHQHDAAVQLQLHALRRAEVDPEALVRPEPLRRRRSSACPVPELLARCPSPRGRSAACRRFTARTTSPGDSRAALAPA